MLMSLYACTSLCTHHLLLDLYPLVCCVRAASYTSRQLSVTDCQQHTFVILIPLHLTSVQLIMHLTCIPSISLNIGALAERTLS